MANFEIIPEHPGFKRTRYLIIERRAGHVAQIPGAFTKQAAEAMAAKANRGEYRSHIVIRPL